MLKNQKFGVEIELTGISRQKAADAIAELFGTRTTYMGGNYREYGVKDNQHRNWKIVRDASIFTQPHNDDNSVEVVSPILTYDDIETIQEILRRLRTAGAKANETCGIHVHIDGANHTAKSLKNVMNFMCSRQDLIYEALNVGANRIRYCKKICPELLNKVKKIRNIDRASIENLWYSPVNHSYDGYCRNDHYNATRYQCLNLHSYFNRGTVEFRMFNSTTHAGELKAYIQFCLAISAWAISSSDRVVFKNISNYTPEQKAEIMVGVLTDRLGMTGDEFKTARLHLTKNLKNKIQVAA